MGTTMTSCLSDSESSYDFADYATFTSSLGLPGYYCDNYKITVYPTNLSTVFTDGKYPERALLYFKLAQGEDLNSGKTTYNAAIVAGNKIPVYDMYSPLEWGTDTLQTQSAHFVGLTQAWESMGYLNIAFGAYVNQSKTVYDFFNLVARPEDQKGDGVLHLTLFHDEEKDDDLPNQANLMIDYRIPSAPELSDKIGEEAYKTLKFFGSSEDSLKVEISAYDVDPITTNIRIQ
jgi:hypothetical protein